jgi:hypothetical protein
VSYLLASITLLLTAADHWTTYLCLRAPVDGWAVTEANPIAEWLFNAVGLVPGLMIDSVVTLFAIAFLLCTPRLPKPLKGAFLACVVVGTGHAVVNNLEAIRMLGLSPLGGV